MAGSFLTMIFSGGIEASTGSHAKKSRVFAFYNFCIGKFLRCGSLNKPHATLLVIADPMLLPVKLGFGLLYNPLRVNS